MPAKIIVKSGYIKNAQHMVNALDYAGNKIEAQLAVLEDGSTVEASADDLIAGEEDLALVRVTLKSGRTINLTSEQYRQKVRERQKPHQEQVLHWEGGEKTFNSEDYIKYIAYRPSVEKAPDRKHGLFTLNGDADMELEKERLKEHQDSVMWSHIISLERPDAERTGYDHREAWQNLVTAKSMEIAKLYNIDPKNLVVNAAYHNKDHHPHLHLYFYSTDPREGIVRDMQYASARLKSLFFNEIFMGDVSYLKEVRTDQRGQMEARLEELLRGIQKQSYRPPKEVCDKLLALSADLLEYKGKNVYAYHKQQIKAQVDEIVELMITKDRHLSRLFDAYLATQLEFVKQYQEDPEKIAARMEEFREHFFHPHPAQRGKPGTGDRTVLHNEVLRYATVLSAQHLSVPKMDTAAEELQSITTAPELFQTAKRKTDSQQDFSPLENPQEESYNNGNRKLHQASIAATSKQAKKKRRVMRDKVQYTAKLLLRSCAYSLAKLARENEQYNGREEKQDSNLTGRRPMQTWRNYKEPEYDYD
ncbi:MobP3 family relaxase [Marasmitruncus massiliensis]|uniref:MobP3 family relaxase n=1 Tax=Marasmitruncus massiliensis TaxID=1944642 RepID=UPI000C7B1BED|nr:MobP3 family relaxase [Marasmitruncus massiliensis]